MDRSVVVAGLQGEWYWLVAAVFLVTMLLLWQVVRSPFGRTLVAIHDNKQLAKFIGVDTDRYQTVLENVAAAAAIADRRYILDEGRIVEEVTTEQLCEDEKMRRRYFSI